MTSERLKCNIHAPDIHFYLDGEETTRKEKEALAERSQNIYGKYISESYQGI